MFNQVDEAVKTERLAILQDLLNQQQVAFNESQIGRTLPVLFEKAGRKEGQLHGRSPYLQSVHVDGPDHLIGRIADVRIEAASRNALTGQLVDGERSAA